MLSHDGLMNLLFDESLPRRLAEDFPGEFEVSTVQRMGWSGRSNGDLLALAAAHGFDAFITADRGIEFQQNIDTLPIPVVVMIASRTRVQELRPLVYRVVDIVIGDLEKRVYRVA